MASKLVLPGQQVAVSEEGVASSGTTEADGVIYASVAGTVFVDPQTYSISVKPTKPLAQLKAGDLVYGIVHDIYDTVALIEFRAEETGGERKSAFNKFSYLRISDVSRDYIENFRDVLRIGDAIRARIKEIKPLGIYLTVQAADLGVVTARCTVCRKVLQPAGRFLKCPNCQNREQRKYASTA